MEFPWGWADVGEFALYAVLGVVCHFLFRGWSGGGDGGDFGGGDAGGCGGCGGD
jgi:hypothetical protein